MNKSLLKHACSYPWQQMIIDLTGEVVPCCYWSGYGNTGKPLGNTNRQTLDNIWNGTGYRELRQRMASGDIADHPCGNCMAYRWANGEFPKFSWPAGFTLESGYCYLAQIPEEFLQETHNKSGTALVYEDGKPLPFPDALHDEIRSFGCGRYSVWGGWLYFSTSDNSDPASNGRVYELRCEEMSIVLGNLVQESASGRNLLKAYEEYQAGRETMTAKPSMLAFISTADCNIDCPACSQNTVRLTRVQHRRETVPDILAHIPYLHQFIWHGGEPYLIRSFREFIDNFRREDNPNLTFGFTSNGTMISEAEAEKLTRFPRINASISIDSFNRQTFETIRAGANLDRVLTNVLRLMKMHNAPERVFSVGMIICKTNVLELPDNLRAAFAYDIGLNLSPVVLYPVTEQLNVFEDFATQTVGWKHAIERAAAVVADAKKQNCLAIRRVDSTGMLDELKTIYEAAAAFYADALTIQLEVHDPHGSLMKMRQPGVIAKLKDVDQPLAYVDLSRGRKYYGLKLPRSAFSGGVPCALHIVHDLLEPMGNLMQCLPLVTRDTKKVVLAIPPFIAPPRPRNAHYVNYGDTTLDGLFVHTPQDIFLAYKELLRREQKGGYGVQPARDTRAESKHGAQ